MRKALTADERRTSEGTLDSSQAFYDDLAILNVAQLRECIIVSAVFLLAAISKLSFNQTWSPIRLENQPGDRDDMGLLEGVSCSLIPKPVDRFSDCLHRRSGESEIEF